MTKTRSEEPRSNPSQSFSTRLRNSNACENMHDRFVVMVTKPKSITFENI